MKRVPPGIQLGKTNSPVLLRAASAAVGLALLAGLGGAVSLWRGAAALRAIEMEGSGAVSGLPIDAPAALDLIRVGETAALLHVGAGGNAPRFGAVLDVLGDAAPDGLRITGIELRPGAEPGIVEASIAAEAPDSNRIAAFLAALAGLDPVRSTREIQESRATGGAATVRVSLRFDAGAGDGVR